MAEGATVILVHGSWFRPSCWDGVCRLLISRGVPVKQVSRLTGGGQPRVIGAMPTNVAIVRGVLDSTASPIVLCGHSAGGGIITRAANGYQSVRHLVYIAGFMTRDGETPVDLGGEFHPRFAAALEWREDGTTALNPAEARWLFFNDCRPAVADRASLDLVPQELGSRAGRDGYGVAWESITSTYVVCTEDQALSVDVQRAVARRASEVVEWQTGHAPFLSRPELVADLLSERAAG